MMHLPSIKKQEETKLTVPGDTRWNSLADCLDGYLKNWTILTNLKLAENIENKITDMNIRRNAEELLKRLQPIAKSFMMLQSNKTKISEAVDIWKNMKSELQEFLTSKEEAHLVKRYYKYPPGIKYSGSSFPR